MGINIETYRYCVGLFMPRWKCSPNKHCKIKHHLCSSNSDNHWGVFSSSFVIMSIILYVHSLLMVNTVMQSSNYIHCDQSYIMGNHRWSLRSVYLCTLQHIPSAGSNSSPLIIITFRHDDDKYQVFKCCDLLRKYSICVGDDLT